MIRTIYLLLLLSLAAGAENLLPGDSSFETGFGCWQPVGKIQNGNAPDGGSFLEISRCLTSSATFALKPETPYCFSVWMRAEKPDTPVMLQAYRTNWDGKYPNTVVKASTEWKRYSLTIPPQQIGGHNTFWLVVAPQNGTPVQLDAIQLEPGKEPTAYAASEPVSFICDLRSPVPGNLFQPGETIAPVFRFYNSTGEERKGEFSVTVTDYYGNRSFERSESVSLAPGKRFEREYALGHLSNKGFYQIDYRWSGAPGKTASFCLLAPPKAKRADAVSLFGICGGPDERVPAIARMGAKSQPVTFRWSYDGVNRKFLPELERRMDEEVAIRLRHGVEPVIYLRRTPPWAAMAAHPHDEFPPKDEFVDDFADFAGRVATRYQGKVRAYQMWGGETDLLAVKVQQELGKDPEWFANRVAELCKAGYRAVKKADPSALVETAAVSGVDCTGARFPFMKRVLPKIAGHFDAVVIHPYCYPSTFDGSRFVQSPEENGMIHTYNEISRLAGGKPVVNGEFGFSINQTERCDSPASKRMGDFLARTFLLSAASKPVTRVMWYSVAANDTYSIWDWPNPRPAVAAYSALAQLLEGADDPVEIPFGSMVRGYAFRQGAGSVAALWAPEASEVAFAMPRDQVEVLDIMGNPVPEGKPVPLSGSPVYFRTDLPRQELIRRISAGKLHIQPLTLDLRLERAGRARLYLRNLLREELNGKLTLTLPGVEPRVISLNRLRPGVDESITVEWSSDKPLNGGKWRAVVETAEGNACFEGVFELIGTPFLSEAPKIDGDLSEWRQRPAMVLDNATSLFPPDAMSHRLWLNAADLSVKAWTGWDDHYFYFAAQVSDDVFRNPEGAESIWAGDSIQLAFDTANNALRAGYREDEREFNIGYSEKEKRAVVSQSWPLPGRFPKTVKVAVVPCENRIDYELAIPFALLKPLAPVPGSVFGFNFVALDRDLNKVDYWMGLTYGICGGKNPSLFKKFILEK